MNVRYVVSLVMVGGALVFGACGGGDDDDSGATGQTVSPSNAATSGATRPAEQATATRAATQAAATNAPETAGDVLDRLAKALQKATYHANYDVEITAQGQTQTGTAIFASKPPKSVVKISLGVAGSGEFSLTILQDGTSSYFCTGFGAGGQCSKDESLLGPVGDVQKTIDDARGGAAKELEKRTIAGRTARCFETTPTSGSKSTLCFDEKDSVMLYLDSEGFKMTAKDYTSSVDDKLFELPYPVS